MKAKLLSEERANRVYDILVAEAGASPRESDRADFIYHHCVSVYGCVEYRFQGNLCFGGKYRSEWNGVTYYPEDETPEILVIAERINKLLKDMKYNMEYARLDVPLFDDIQNMKDCKKSTPDYIPSNPKKGLLQVGFMTKDEVLLNNVKPLINKGKVLTGVFTFDSYDKYDNTCYVTGGGYGSISWNVLLSDIMLVPIKLKK